MNVELSDEDDDDEDGRSSHAVDPPGEDDAEEDDSDTGENSGNSGGALPLPGNHSTPVRIAAGRINLNGVKPYNGSTRFEDWSIAFDNHVQLIDIKKGKWAAAIVSKMRGPAQMFCYNLPVAVKRNYAELVERLMERYDGQAICESGKWATYKQAATESVEDYAAL